MSQGSFGTAQVQALVGLLILVVIFVWAKHHPGRVIIPNVDGDRLLPYRYGTYCGWVAILSGLFVALGIAVAVRESDWAQVWFSVLRGSLALVAGVGLLKLRRFGVITFFMFCILRLIFKMAELQGGGWEVGFFVAVSLGAFFLPNVIYFKKRWRGLK